MNRQGIGKKGSFFTELFIAMVIVVCFSAVARADLKVVGSGYMVGDPTQTQYQLIYDSAQNITWLDYTNSLNTWQNQVNWASGLTVNFKSQSLTGWSLPTTVDSSSSMNNPCPPTSSQMAYLYYTDLGNQGGVGLTNVGPFKNLSQNIYWSGTVLSSNPLYAWAFDFELYSANAGLQIQPATWYTGGAALAVLPGDIATEVTPTPAPAVRVRSSNSFANDLEFAKLLGNKGAETELSESVKYCICEGIKQPSDGKTYVVFNVDTNEVVLLRSTPNVSSTKYQVLDKSNIVFVGVIYDISCNGNTVKIEGKWAFRATVLKFKYIIEDNKLKQEKVTSSDFTMDQIYSLRDKALEGKILESVNNAFEEGTVLYPQNYFRKNQVLDLTKEALLMGVNKALFYHNKNNNEMAANILKGVFYYSMALYQESYAIESYAVADSNPYLLPPDQHINNGPTYWVETLKAMGVEPKDFITALNDYGYYLYKNNDNKNAIIVLRVVLTEDPGRTMAYLNLADAYYDQKYPYPSQDMYIKYIKMMKDSGNEKLIPSYVLNRAK